MFKSTQRVFAQLATALSHGMANGLKTLDIRLQNGLSKPLSHRDSDCTFALIEAFLKAHHGHMQELRLNNFFSRDMGLEIARMILFESLPALKVLELSGCAIGERGAAALSMVLVGVKTDLVELNLRDNCLTRRDVNQFGLALGLFSGRARSLEKVDLRGNFIDPSIVAAFQSVKNVKFLIEP